MAELNWSQTPTQPHENNGGTPVPMNSAPGNPTKPHPGSGAKKEAGWEGYGKTPKGAK